MSQQRVSKPPLASGSDPFASVKNQGSTSSLLDDLMETPLFSSGSLSDKKLSVASSGLPIPDNVPTGPAMPVGVSYYTPQPQRSLEMSGHCHQHSGSGTDFTSHNNTIL